MIRFIPIFYVVTALNACSVDVDKMKCWSLEKVNAVNAQDACSVDKTTPPDHKVIHERSKMAITRKATLPNINEISNTVEDIRLTRRPLTKLKEKHETSEPVKKSRFTISQNKPFNGTITPDLPIHVTQGQSALLQILPIEGFVVGAVSGCPGALTHAEGQGHFILNPVISDCHISVRLTPRVFTISADINGMGRTEPALPLQAEFGQIQSIKLVPDNNLLITPSDFSRCKNGTQEGDTIIINNIQESCHLQIQFIDLETQQLQKIKHAATVNDASHIVFDDLLFFSPKDANANHINAYQASIANNTPENFPDKLSVHRLINLVNQAMQGDYAYAQTSLTGHNDSRIAPKRVAARDTLLVYDAKALSVQQGFVEIYDGEQLQGIRDLNAPDAFPGVLEQAYVNQPLSTAGTTSWSTTIPWYAVSTDLRVKLVLQVDSLQLHLPAVKPGIFLPEQLYLRSFNKIILWGDQAVDFSYHHKRAQYAQDYFAITPFSQLISADYTDALWPFLIWPNNAPQYVASYAKMIDSGLYTNTYGVLKNHFTQRVMLANIGQGLKSKPMDAHSRYSIANYSASGLRKKPDGKYDNIHQGSAAGGWSGWTALWGDNPGTYAHELGHNFYRSHWFSKGNSSGIYFTEAVTAEYPFNDGEYLSLPPRSYDTTRGLFRAWQRIKNGQIAGFRANGEALGIRDHMSYASDTAYGSLFIPYTPLTTKGIQDAVLLKPTIRVINDRPDTYQWNESSKQYLPLDDQLLSSQITKAGVPVATIIGTLAIDSSTQKLQPPIYSRYGYVYALLDDLQNTDLDEKFPFYLKISYENLPAQFGVIETQTTANLQLFSLNIDMAKRPINIALFHTSDTLNPIHSQTLEPHIPEKTPVIHYMGKGINQPLSPVVFNTACLDNQCLYNRDPVIWQVEPDKGFMTIRFNDDRISVNHGATHSDITLQSKSGTVIARLKVHRQRTGDNQTRPLNKQPDVWHLGDKELITWYDYHIEDTTLDFLSVIELLDNHGKTFGMQNIIVRISEQWTSDYTLSLAALTTDNYTVGLQNTTVFYTVPDQYFASGPTTGKWIAWGSSKIQVRLYHEGSSTYYDTVLKASKNSMFMNSGAFAYSKENYGPLTIKHTANDQLPVGNYFGILKLMVKNWHGGHGSQLDKPIYIAIRFTIN